MASVISGHHRRGVLRLIRSLIERGLFAADGCGSHERRRVRAESDSERVPAEFWRVKRASLAGGLLRTVAETKDGRMDCPFLLHSPLWPGPVSVPLLPSLFPRGTKATQKWGVPPSSRLRGPSRCCLGAAPFVIRAIFRAWLALPWSIPVRCCATGPGFMHCNEAFLAALKGFSRRKSTVALNGCVFGAHVWRRVYYLLLAFVSDREHSANTLSWAVSQMVVHSRWCISLRYDMSHCFPPLWACCGIGTFLYENRRITAESLSFSSYATGVIISVRATRLYTV